MSYVSFENIDNLEVYFTDLDSGDKTVVTEDIDFLSLGLLESHGLNITNSKSEISNSGQFHIFICKINEQGNVSNIIPREI